MPQRNARLIENDWWLMRRIDTRRYFSDLNTQHPNYTVYRYLSIAVKSRYWKIDMVKQWVSYCYVIAPLFAIDWFVRFSRKVVYASLLAKDMFQTTENLRTTHDRALEALTVPGLDLANHWLSGIFLVVLENDLGKKNEEFSMNFMDNNGQQ